MCNSNYPSNKILLNTIPQEKITLLKAHLSLVLESNKKINLTRIESEERGLILHIEDSLAALPEINDSPEGLYIDLGTGGGFPGIPIGVVTGRKTLLVDSVQKKIKEIDAITETLGITGLIATYAGRAEELAINHKEEAAVITARALSSLPSLMELASPLLMISGRLVCYKAAIEEHEIEEAIKLKKKLGMKLISDRGILLSDNEAKRRIITFEKVDSPQVILPRRPGMAQKRPYKA